MHLANNSPGRLSSACCLGRHPKAPDGHGFCGQLAELSSAHDHRKTLIGGGSLRHSRSGMASRGDAMHLRNGEPDRQLCTSGGEPITRPVLLLELLSRLVGGIVGWLWLDGETQRADLTAADFLVRGSVAVGVFAVLLWLIFR
jgi:hypothetical protein